ncbi:MAG: hypothetical protein JO089_02035 [Alphaproteobacteria bacterium]|nr:hypothetical protein [Alphaproteobacteria bacterium]
MYNSKDNAGGKSDAKRALEEVTDDLCDVARNAGRKVRGALDCATDELTGVTDTVAAEIRNKPVQSSLIALAAGFLLGALFRR